MPLSATRGARSARPGRLVLALACALLAAGEARGDALSYRIEGVSGAARDNLRAHLGPSPATEADAAQFLVTAPQRAREAMETLGFYGAEIDVRVDRDRRPARATLHVTAGEPVRYAVFDLRMDGPGSGDAGLAAVLEERAPRVGAVLHHGDYEAFKAALLRRARQRGFFEARFAQASVAVDAREATATAQLVFDTGERARFGAVTAPAELLAPAFLDSLLPFAPGDAYDEAKLLELRNRLQRLGFFNSVVVLPDLAARDGNVVPVRAELLPAPRHSFEVGVGYSTDTRHRVSLQWRSPRLNRHGHSQQTRLRYSPVNPALRTTYTVPLDDPALDLLQFGARLEDNEFGDIDSLQRELSLGRETSRGTRVRGAGVRYLNESWTLLEEEFDADYLLAGASYSTRWRRGNAVDPARGVSQFYSLEGGSRALGADEDLLRLLARLGGVWRFSKASRLVTRLDAGLLYTSSDRPDDLPPSLAFFAGGDSSIRGFAYQSIGREVSVPDRQGRTRRLVVGGTRLVAASVEYQHYVNDDWRAAVFADAGDAFNAGNFDLQVGAGVGVHYLTPIGAIRVDVARPVSGGGDWRLHLTIGAEL
jgi:translocation and assembly module TamA